MCWTVHFLSLFLAIVNLQYLTILIKSELQDVNLQFQYRNLNCEIKRSQIWFSLFYSVMETSPKAMYVVFFVDPWHQLPRWHNPHPALTHWKQFQSRFQLNVCIGDPIFSIVHSIK